MSSDEIQSFSNTPSPNKSSASTATPNNEAGTQSTQDATPSSSILTPSKNLSISPPSTSTSTSKSQQHRLGVSASGRAAIAKPEPRAKSKPGWSGEGFGGYMREKNRKLREQFDAEAQPTAQSTLFASVTVWVTGATRPPRTEIRRLLAAHGGKFETYLSREKVTHIIADNLATATRRRLASAPGKPSPYTIVKAAWITDSIAAGILLPPTQYTVGGMNDPGQRRVSSFFRSGDGTAAHKPR